jgi:hypothetical protein
MEPFNTKINHFSGWNLPQWPLSLSRLESEDSLNKKGKKEENEFGTKMYFLEIQGPSHFIPKKYWGLKWMFEQNFQPAPSVTWDFHFIPLAFNSILLPKKMQLRANLGSKDSNQAK